MDITTAFFGKIEGLMIFRDEKPKESIVGVEKYIELIKKRAP